ncbi:MAG: protein kinase domain-containing protein [Acidimicrobiales bacterium]
MVRSRLAEQVGRVVGGRYRLLAPVGTGASADVYVADDVTLRRRVAVKLLHDQLATDKAFLRRFRAEARTVAALRHPNIMAVFDWGEEDGAPFLVLEYLSGGSLRDLLDRGHRLTPSQATMIGLEAARGLDHAHRRGLVHRDVKPANLLFDDEGRLVIADFGIARALAEATWTEPVGAVVGTARYAAPEQARGASLDGKADVYALALVLVEAVTGALPFAADTTLATVMGRLDRPIPTTSELGPLGPVIAAAGAVEPADRVDAAGLIMALEEAATELPAPKVLPLAPVQQHPVAEPREDHTTVYAPQPEVASVTPPEAPPSQVPVAEMAPAPRRPRRWRYPWIAIAVIAVAALVGLGLLATSAFAKSSYRVPEVSGLYSQLPKFPHFSIAEHQVREGPPLGKVLRQTPPAGTRHHAGTITVDVSVGYPLVAVPDLNGKTKAQADALLASLLLKRTFVEGFSDSVAAGYVATWSGKGTQVEQQTTTITVTISGGARFEPMPDVTGKTVQDATATLYAAGITNSPAQVQAFSDSVPSGSVISTDPPPGAQADRAGTPTLTVSKGPEEVKVPDVTGETVSVAEAQLTAAGLVPSGPYGPPGADVVQQTSPRAGRKVKSGSTVVLYVGYF